MKRKLSATFTLIMITLTWLTGCSPSGKNTPLPGEPQVSKPTLIMTPRASGPGFTPSATPIRLPSKTVTIAPTQTAIVRSITLSGHACGVSQLQWSPDGSQLASTCGFLNFTTADKTVRLWYPNGNIAHVLGGYTQPVMSLDWSPDSKILATSAMDGTIKLWSNDGQPIEQWQGNAGNVFAVDWSPNGEILATGSIVTYTNPTVQLWDPNGRIITTLSTSYSGGKFYNLAWSPDGKYLLGGATDYKLWKADGEQVFWLTACAHCTPAWGMAWSPDSQMWAEGNENGEVEIYNTAGKLLADMQDRTAVNSLAWSPDSRKLAGGKSLWAADGTVLANLSLPTLRVNCVAWSPDGSLFATGDDHGLIDLFSAAGEPMGRLNSHSSSIGALAWSPDGKILASGSDDMTIRLWMIR